MFEKAQFDSVWKGGDGADGISLEDVWKHSLIPFEKGAMAPMVLADRQTH